MEQNAPLNGIRIVEFAGLGPGPFAGMMLADMGADVIRIDRPVPSSLADTQGYLGRGRRSIALNLKDPVGVKIALKLIADADGLIEGFRPGVMERLGLGPKDCHAVNTKLIYGRMTGWGQSGPLAQSAGHDLNYIAITGALWATGEKGHKPSFPMNLLGDFGGGGMYLAFGMLAGLLKAKMTGEGDVIDAAISDGTSSLMAMIYGMRSAGMWKDERQTNLLDGGVPWYNIYECSDGRWVSIGALEPQFWACLVEKLGLDQMLIWDRDDPKNWAGIEKVLTDTFLSKTRDDWCDLLEGTDACFAPVLSLDEAAKYEHNVARKTFQSPDCSQPMPAPRFRDSRTDLPDTFHRRQNPQAGSSKS